MSIDLFIMLFGIGSVVASLVTEALKKNFKNVSSNVIALIVAVIVGGVGTFVYYILTGAEITPINAIYAVLMALCVWLGSMVGYDKVMQTLKQIGANYGNSNGNRFIYSRNRTMRTTGIQDIGKS